MATSSAGASGLADLPVSGERAVILIAIFRTSLAVPVDVVESVSEAARPTPLPGAPAHIPGLVASGERALPLVDLAIMLGIPDSGRAPDPMFARILFVRAGELEAGLICHRARGVVSVAADALQPPAVLQGARLRPFLEAELEHGGMVVGVLDTSALLKAAAVT